VIKSGRLDRDPTSEIKKGERLTGSELGFQVAGEKSGKGALEVDGRRGSGDLWITATSRQDAGGRGGLGSLI
jgi:hypothetical protein